jgi:hypothetical protein
VVYEPKTGEQLAALRATRERKKAQREEKRWAEENPLLAWARAGRSYSGWWRIDLRALQPGHSRAMIGAWKTGCWTPASR